MPVSGLSIQLCIIGGTDCSLGSRPGVEATRERPFQRFAVLEQTSLVAKLWEDWLKTRPHYYARGSSCVYVYVFCLPVYRTECAKRSCCWMRLSHMEAVRPREYFGDVTSGIDQFSSSSSFLPHRVCCHSHLLLLLYLWSCLRSSRDCLGFLPVPIPLHVRDDKCSQKVDHGSGKVFRSGVWGSPRLNERPCFIKLSSLSSCLLGGVALNNTGCLTRRSRLFAATPSRPEMNYTCSMKPPWSKASITILPAGIVQPRQLCFVLLPAKNTIFPPGNNWDAFSSGAFVAAAFTPSMPLVLLSCFQKTHLVV